MLLALSCSKSLGKENRREVYETARRREDTFLSGRTSKKKTRRKERASRGVVCISVPFLLFFCPPSQLLPPELGVVRGILTDRRWKRLLLFFLSFSGVLVAQKGAFSRSLSVYLVLETEKPWAPAIQERKKERFRGREKERSLLSFFRWEPFQVA